MTLSPRQREALQFLADGHAPKRCADVLGITPRTLRQHLTVAKSKLRARDSTHAVALAMRAGVVE